MSRYDTTQQVNRNTFKQLLSLIIKVIRSTVVMILFFLRQPLIIFTNFFLILSLVGVFFSLFIFNDSSFAWNMGKLSIVMLITPFLYDFLLGMIATKD